jgi:hypothetical protein
MMEIGMRKAKRRKVISGLSPIGMESKWVGLVVLTFYPLSMFLLFDRKEQKWDLRDIDQC